MKTDVKNNELRIGVIGAGGRGWVACYAHKPKEGSVIAALCDNRPEALKGWDETIGDGPAPFKTSDYREVLDRDDIDAVFITVPDFMHEEVAVDALEAGKTVYLEKPMAITIEGCDRVLATAARTGTKLFVGHNMRHMPFVLKMKEIIDSGRIGQIQCAWCRHFVNYGGDAYFKDWHSERKNTTGLLLQKGAHDIDVIHWLAGGYSTRVSAMGRLSVYNRCKNRRPAEQRGDVSWNNSNWPPLELKGISPVIDVEDESSVMMELDNGILANYMQCHYAPDACRNYTFIGDAGRVENVTEKFIAIYTSRCEHGEPDELLRIDPTSGSHGGADSNIVAAFLRYAKGESGMENNSPIAARNSVAAGVSATWSLRNGNMPVDIPPIPEESAKYFAAMGVK